VWEEGKAREGAEAFRPSRFVYGKTGKQQILEESSSNIFFCFFVFGLRLQSWRR
jgi:hypothetical protein